MIYGPDLWPWDDEADDELDYIDEDDYFDFEDSYYDEDEYGD